MARRNRSRSRRSEDFAVRRWLQVGVASAGMGAALWGMSLVGPQSALAAPDEGGSSASSSSASSSSDAGPSKTVAGQGKSSSDTDDAADATPSAKDSDPKDTLGNSDSESDDDELRDRFGDSERETDDTETDDTETDDTETDDPDAEDAWSEDASSDGAASGDDADADAAPAETATDRGDADPLVDRAAPVAQPSVTPKANLVPGATGSQADPSVVTAAAPPPGEPWAVKEVAKAGNPWQANTSAIITATTSNVRLLITALPLPPELRDALIGTMWTMRRTFFNLAPTMDEKYSVSSGLGPILGQVTATDPEGDKIRYRVVKGPQYGTLELNVDGSYTYTPNQDFDGVDTFVIRAADLGLHVNLIQPFRAPGASSGLLVNQNAIDFEFDYNDPDDYFTDEAKEALYQSAKRLSVYFIVNQKTVLTYSVNSEFTPDGFLASAGSDLVSDDPGFWYTVVQQKLLDGTDANGDAADGRINWNWAWDWGFYPAVGSEEYDFTSTVMHELLHSFGWLSYVEYPGDTDETAWTVYDQFVTTRHKDSPIDEDTYLWDPFYDRYLTGFDGGMYFSGANAMAAFGGRPVPLYSPAVWAGGSSISHLDDGVFSGPNHAMMDHAAAGMGPDNISLSPVELGVLMDLGYTVVAWPWFNYPPAGGRPSVL